MNSRLADETVRAGDEGSTPAAAPITKPERDSAALRLPAWGQASAKRNGELHSRL
jgi:hypothetical protein